MMYNYDGVDEMQFSKKTIRSDEEKRKLLSKINRISGKVNAINKMIEDDTYCNDILIQAVVVEKVLRSLVNLIFE